MSVEHVLRLDGAMGPTADSVVVAPCSIPWLQETPQPHSSGSACLITKARGRSVRGARVTSLPSGARTTRALDTSWQKANLRLGCKTDAVSCVLALSGNTKFESLEQALGAIVRAGRETFYCARS